jgi:hypothetical protein
MVHVRAVRAARHDLPVLVDLNLLRAALHEDSTIKRDSGADEVGLRQEENGHG